MNRVGMGLAVGAGYLLGRTKKLKLAFAVGTVVAGKRMHLSPKAVADLVSQQLLKNPQFKEIGDTLREDLRGVGKAASGAMVERQIEALADRLHGRTAQVRDQLSDVAPEVPGLQDDEDSEEDEEPDEEETGTRGGKNAEADQEPSDEDEADEDDDEVDDDAEAEADDEDDDESDEAPAAAKRTAKRAPAKKSAAKKAPAKKAPAKKASPSRTAGKKTAAKKTTAKKTAAKKTTAARGAGRGTRARMPKGGGE
ncbi:DNA primase [Streptomyces griseorubiginosus]|jgi:cobalamin biosynthesis protein CobT|uniref:DNA primase n=1 Tax=Streptomyces griseorubiginosus TaxID=67304 RepID=UPI0036ECC615